MATLADALMMQALSPARGGSMTPGGGLASAGSALSAALLGRLQLERDYAREGRLAQALTGIIGGDEATNRAYIQGGLAEPLLAAALKPRDTIVVGQGEKAVEEGTGKLLFEGSPKLSTTEQQVKAAGFDPASPEGQEFARRILTQAKTSVTVGAPVVNLPSDPSTQFIKGAKGELYRILTDDKGKAIGVEPMPGTVEALDRQQEAGKQAAREQRRTTTADVVGEDIKRALDMAGGWTTGVAGQLLSGVGGTGAHDLNNLVNTLKANVGFEQLQSMREASPTGGALGPVSDAENKLLQSVLGSLETSQSKDQFQFNLKRLYNVTMDTVHGSGNGPKRYDLTSPQGEVSLGTGKVTIPPREQRTVGQVYTNAQGYKARWTGDGWEPVQ